MVRRDSCVDAAVRGEQRGRRADCVQRHRARGVHRLRFSRAYLWRFAASIWALARIPRSDKK